MHDRKKHGERKDKKNVRMRDANTFKHAMADDERPTTDQHDVVGYKPGGPRDRNRQPRPRPEP